nr:O-acetyl-ADP-ribose deacetylase [uncultured Holophaga sp.]
MTPELVAVQGDITVLPVEAIVNAANESLLGGGGVDGAIHRAAGPELLAHCRELGGCLTGEARLTPGFRLLALHIIHTVGPVWQGGHAGEDELLAACYRNTMKLACARGVHSIAFPAISTGAFGFPLRRASRIAIATIREFMSRPDCPERILLVAFDGDTLQVLRGLLQEPS